MDDSTAKEGIYESALACLAIIARFNGLATDVEQLRHRHPPGAAFTRHDLIRVARVLGLKARSVSADWERLPRMRLPALARHKDGHYLIIARVEDGKALIQDPLARALRSVSRADLEECWSGELILVARRTGGDAQRPFNLAWFMPAIVKYRRLFAEVLCASLFIQLFALVTPLFFQVVIDKVLVHRGLTTLDVICAGYLIVVVFDVVLSGMRSYVFAHTTNRIDVELGARLYRHLTALPLAYFQVRRVGDSVARVRELENIRGFLTGSALTVVLDSFFTIVFFAVMFHYSAPLCGLVLASLPLYLLLSLCVTPMFRRRLNEKFDRGAENQAFLVESVSGIETVKAMAVEPQLQRQWEDQLASYVRAAFCATNLGNIAGQAAALVGKVCTLLILWFGARFVIEGQMTVGQLVAFNMMAGRVTGPILRLVQLWQEFQQAGLSIRRLGDILNTPAEPTYSNRSSLPAVKGRVTFDHVSFRYRPDRAEVLKDIALDVRPGEVVGIVGRSGSGKSTLTKLLQRLYVPESGRVLVDGVDLTVVDPAWLRRQVGFVLQESVLFNRSIRQNIALIDPALPMEVVANAAQLAGAHEFIAELPEGYDTLVGEHGATLSGGQRQRIAIARALIGNPRILILDEATSALDYESEAIIQRNMRMICKGRTVFIIAHRLSAVRHADRIVVMERGRVVEQGPHDVLLARGGQYARLHALQTHGLADMRLGEVAS